MTTTTIRLYIMRTNEALNLIIIVNKDKSLIT